MARFLFTIALFCLALCPTLEAQAQRQKGAPKSSPKILAAFREVVAKPSQSTVRIRCGGEDVALGTVVGDDGWILTKASELKGGILCNFKDGRELEARLVSVHEPNDLALLKVDAKGLSPIAWSDSKSASVGNWIATPGLGDEPAAVGVVSVATRSVSTKNTSTLIAPASAGYLGVGMEPVDTGVKITQIIPGSGADKAGLKANDIILAVGKKLIDDQEAVVNLIARHKPGDILALRVKRGSEELELKATLGKRPEGRSDSQNRMGGDLSDRRGGFPTILQHDTVLRPGDCGGPLVDLDGKAVGINIARAGRTESYAIPSETIQPLLKDMKAGKYPPKEEPAKKSTPEK